MRWSSSISDLPDLEAAVDAALDGAAVELDPDLITVFVSGHDTKLAEVPRRVRERFPRAHVLGCSAAGVLGGGLEIEGRRGVAVSLASLPGVEIVPFQLDEPGGPLPSADAHLLLLDPFSVDSAAIVDALDREPSVKLGGLASGARGAQALFLDDATHPRGALGLALRGVKVQSIVAQGCRPIGDAMFVTRHRDSVILELNGKPVVQVIRDLFATLAEADQALFRRALFLGLGMDQDKREYRHGDFLVRNVGGLQREGGGLLVGTKLPRYAVVQFHLRDAAAAAQELEALLARAPRGVEGALLFSCVGRGEGLYGHPNHDSDAFHRVFGELPLAGFFCNGEIAPLGGKTFLHGQTSAFALFG